MLSRKYDIKLLASSAAWQACLVVAASSVSRVRDLTVQIKSRVPLLAELTLSN